MNISLDPLLDSILSEYSVLLIVCICISLVCCGYIEVPDSYTGIRYTYHQNGQKKSSTPYVNGIKQGIAGEWNEYWQISEIPYVNGKIHGMVREWHGYNGELKSIRRYFDGKLDGVSEEWYEHGVKKSRTIYYKGIQQETTQWDTTGKQIKSD